MYIKISEDEYRALESALSVRLVQMRDELAHTDDRAYHAELRNDLERLEELERRVVHAHQLVQRRAA